MTIPSRKFVIAVVDDDQRVIESLENLLESAGYAVCAFSSGPALLASGRLKDAACLLTDIGMPGMDGLELQRVVGEQHPGLPVILITGRHEAVEAAQAIPGRFFRKPFDGPALLAAIGEARKGKESSHECKSSGQTGGAVLRRE